MAVCAGGTRKGTIEKVSADIPYLYEHNGFYLYRRAVRHSCAKLLEKRNKILPSNIFKSEALQLYGEADIAAEQRLKMLQDGVSTKEAILFEAFAAQEAINSLI
ncbi:hypothetical protein HED54_23095 [Ochrobactrum anthropi ATCC 49188]|nr:hypothetical protein [Brucella anthropi ATCC 49188]